MSRNTVKYIVARNRTNSPAVGKRGRKFALTERCIRKLIRCVRMHRFKPLFVISNEFRTVDGKKLSVRTIRRYLQKHGIKNYAAVSKPFLSRKHINARLHWTQVY